MDELISRAEFLKGFSYHAPEERFSPDEVIYLLNKAPSVPAEVVRHGRWRYQHDPIKDPKRYFVRIICSVCGLITGQKSSYCPNCGAKMDGQGEGDSNED